MSYTFAFRILMFFALNFLSFYAVGQEKLVQKSKSYSKSYPIGDADKVSISNKFGEVKVITWSKSEIKVECTIKVQSNDDALAQSLLDNIEIKDNRTNGLLSFTTIIEKGNTTKIKKNNKKDESMNINYVVSMPSKSGLTIKNQFGAITLPDYVGEINLESQFGSITSGKLSNVKSIDVKFGDAEILQMNNGFINGQYANVGIKDIEGTFKGVFQFSTVYLNVDNKLTKLSLKDTYTNTAINLDKKMNAVFKIDVDNGALNNKSSFKIDKKPESNTKAIYTSSTGGGASVLEANSSFGTLELGHDLKQKIKKKKTF